MRLLFVFEPTCPAWWKVNESYKKITYCIILPPELFCAAQMCQGLSQIFNLRAGTYPVEKLGRSAGTPALNPVASQCRFNHWQYLTRYQWGHVPSYLLKCHVSVCERVWPVAVNSALAGHPRSESDAAPWGQQPACECVYVYDCNICCRRRRLESETRRKRRQTFESRRTMCATSSHSLSRKHSNRDRNAHRVLVRCH